MAKTTQPDVVVIVDDELHNMVWLEDYLIAKGLTVLKADNLNVALPIIEVDIFRALIVDLNVPVLPPLDEVVRRRGGVYSVFPGLYFADFARNRGYRDRQVILYSVHKDPGVQAEATKLGCTYLLKGRPREIKEELDAVISFDPTAE